MASSLTTTQTISFTPDAGGAPAEEDDTPALEVILTTELKGVLTRSVSGCTLCASLLIEFVVRSLCERARLVGIAPTDHAPLVIPEARYLGSSCAYGGPEGDPWRVYSDASYSEQDHGSTLVIDWPAGNLFAYFTWPDPIVEYDPPIAPGESFLTAWQQAMLDGLNALRAEQSLEPLLWCIPLATAAQDHIEWCVAQNLISHAGENGNNATDRAAEAGYATPVAEILVRTARTVAIALDSWRHSAGHYAIIMDPAARVVGVGRAEQSDYPGYYSFGASLGFVVAGTEFVQMELAGLLSLFPATGEGEEEHGVQLPMRMIALKDAEETAVSELLYEEAPGFTGSGDHVTCKLSPAWSLTAAAFAEALEPGDYDLYWRLYKGGGDMLYRAMCGATTLKSLYRDRRNPGIGGGFGQFLTSDLLAARVRVEPQPLPFLVTTVAPGGWSVCLEKVYRIDASYNWVTVAGRDAVSYARDGSGSVAGNFAATNYLNKNRIVRDPREEAYSSSDAHTGWTWSDGSALAPLNASAGAPYFTLPAATWDAWKALSTTAFMAFRREAAGTQYSVAGDGTARLPARALMAGGRRWTGGDEVLSWDGPYLYLGGQELWCAPSRVLCACLINGVDGQAVRYLTDGGHFLTAEEPVVPSYDGTLWERALMAGAEPVARAQAVLPRLAWSGPGYPSTPTLHGTRYLWAELDSYRFNAAGTRIVASRRPAAINGDWSNYDYIAPGAAWEAVYTPASEGQAAQLAWSTLMTSDPRASFQGSDVGYGVMRASARALLGAWYRGDQRVVREIQVESYCRNFEAEDRVTVLDDGAASETHAALVYNYLSGLIYIAGKNPQPTTVAPRVLFPRTDDGKLHVLRIEDRDYALLPDTGTPPARPGYFAARSVTVTVEGAVAGAWAGQDEYPLSSDETWQRGGNAWYPGETYPAIADYAKHRRHALGVLGECLYNDGLGASSAGLGVEAKVISEFEYASATHGGVTLIGLRMHDAFRAACVGGTLPEALDGQPLTDIRLVTPRACLEAVNPAKPTASPRRRIAEQAAALLEICNARRAIANDPPLVWSPALCVAAAWMSRGHALWAEAAGFAPELDALAFTAEVAPDDLAAAAEACSAGLLASGLIYFGAYTVRTVDTEGAPLADVWSVVLGGQQ